MCTTQLMKLIDESFCGLYQRALLEAVKANSQIPHGPPTQFSIIINRTHNIYDTKAGCRKKLPENQYLGMQWAVDVNKINKVAVLEWAKWSEMDKTNWT